MKTPKHIIGDQIRDGIREVSYGRYFVCDLHDPMYRTRRFLTLREAKQFWDDNRAGFTSGGILADSVEDVILEDNKKNSTIV